MDRCQWCWGVTGHVVSCQCRTQCGSTKCPAGVDRFLDDFYGWSQVPVPVFRSDQEDQSE